MKASTQIGINLSYRVMSSPHRMCTPKGSRPQFIRVGARTWGPASLSSTVKTFSTILTNQFRLRKFWAEHRSFPWFCSQLSLMNKAYMVTNRSYPPNVKLCSKIGLRPRADSPQILKMTLSRYLKCRFYRADYLFTIYIHKGREIKDGSKRMQKSGLADSHLRLARRCPQRTFRSSLPTLKSNYVCL